MHNSAKRIIKQYHDNQEMYRSLKHDIDDILHVLLKQIIFVFLIWLFASRVKML